MKQLLVGGGPFDLATLHPVATLLAFLALALGARWAIRAYRRARVRR
jgi:hypothetical protein